jgi:hypothetical protein
MRGLLRPVRRTLPFAWAVVVLGACGGTSTPTATEVAAAAKAPSVEAVATSPTSIAVSGTVFDSANRPVAGANIECPGSVHCSPNGEDVGADGHEHRVLQTDANGAYKLVANGQSADSFPMNANGQGYQVAWRQVAWPDASCTWEQAHCAVTVNFTLAAVLDE